MSRKNQQRSAVSSLLILQFLGDLVVCFLGLSAAYWIRFESPLRRIGNEGKDITYEVYLPLLITGTIFFIASFSALSLYNASLLLRPHRAVVIIMRGVFFWVLAFLGISLALKFDPAISRLFVLSASATTLLLIVAWRLAFFSLLNRSLIRREIVQDVACLGWSEDAAKLVEAIGNDHNHPYEIVGVIATRQHSREALNRLPMPIIGDLDGLDAILANGRISILVVADLDLSRDELVRVANFCERHYVSFKVIPSFFQIFVSNLRLQTVSGVPLLGIEALPLDTLPAQLIKRSVDIFGSLVGMLGSMPIMLVLVILIRREDPGPVIYRQTRVGINGRPFIIYKLRSMKLNAETGTGPQWAVKSDPRRLKIGAFMREWNLDELPQFWNVLRGDMSLVGPRPERPELIAQFEREIPHYNPRHSVRPGLSGWAQVNGLRGDTSLVERIKYDLYYIENWSPWFDIQIMFLTFIRRQNAY